MIPEPNVAPPDETAGEREESPRCDHCGESCAVRVDDRFPAAARQAYLVRSRTWAATCNKGQTIEMAKLGWCVDRAVSHPEWTGGVPYGVHPSLVQNRTRTKKRDLKLYPEGGTR